MYPGAHAAQTPDRPAAIMHETGECLTCAELEERSTRLSRLLYDAGLRPGDGVALIAENNPDVLDVAVIGVPDEEMGESVLAVVQPMPGVAAGPELERRLIGFARDSMAHYKAPAGWTSPTRCRALPPASCASTCCAKNTPANTLSRLP